MLVFVVLALISASVADHNHSEKITSFVPIYTSEYLNKILTDREQNPVVGGSMISDVDIDSFLTRIGLNAAAKISKQIQLRHILSQHVPGPFTMIMPSDQAIKQFKQVRPEVAADQSALIDIIKAGIVSGTELSSAAISNEKVVRSISGAKLRFNIYQKSGTQVKTVNGARLVDVDRETTNIVVHVIDHVIYPIPDGNIVQILSRIPRCSILVDLITKAGMVDFIAETEPLTVLAPTNRAFENLPAGSLADLKQNIPNLQKVLKYHVIRGSQFSAGLHDGQQIESAQQGAIDVKMDPNGEIELIDQTSESAFVVVRDAPADNGVIHVIDRVLVPPQTHFDFVFV